jgi:hypothetical protein
MNDEAQRGEVVALLDVVRQPQQAHEHGRHHMHMGDAVAHDQLQHVFGIEARFEHDGAAVTERQHAVGIRRRMIHRAVHQDDLIFLWLKAIGDGADAFGRTELFRLHRLAAHALRHAGRARGIEHRRTAARRLQRRGVAVAPNFPVGQPGRDLHQFGRDVERGGDFRRR